MRARRSSEQRGQSVVEYALVLLVVALALVSFSRDVATAGAELVSFVVTLAIS